jgi:hypothetical protein
MIPKESHNLPTNLGRFFHPPITNLERPNNIYPLSTSHRRMEITGVCIPLFQPTRPQTLEQNTIFTMKEMAQFQKKSFLHFVITLLNNTTFPLQIQPLYFLRNS